MHVYMSVAPSSSGSTQQPSVVLLSELTQQVTDEKLMSDHRSPAVTVAHQNDTRQQAAAADKTSAHVEVNFA